MQCPSSFTIFVYSAFISPFFGDPGVLFRCHFILISADLSGTINQDAPPPESMLKPLKAVGTFPWEGLYPIEFKLWPLASSKQFCHKDQTCKPGTV